VGERDAALRAAAAAAGHLLIFHMSSRYFTWSFVGLTPTNATNLVAASAVMVVVALAACTLPALRATRIDSLACIREE
jgi:hypothetical protein